MENSPTQTRANGLRAPAERIADTPGPPDQKRRYHPRPYELPHDGRPPLPSPPEIDELLRQRLAFDPSAGKSKAGMVFRAQEEANRGCKTLEDHAHPDEDKNLVTVCCATPFPYQGSVRPSLFFGSPHPTTSVIILKLLLQLRHVQEPKIGGMKQRNTEREPRAHDEVLNIVGNDNRHGAPDRVHYLRHAPVQVQQHQAAEGQGQAADAQSGDVPIPEAERHA